MLETLGIYCYSCAERAITRKVLDVCWYLDSRCEKLNGGDYSPGLKTIAFFFNCFPSGTHVSVQRTYSKKDRSYYADVMLEEAELRGLDREAVLELAIQCLFEELPVSVNYLRKKKELVKFDFGRLTGDIEEIVRSGEVSFEMAPVPQEDAWLAQLLHEDSDMGRALRNEPSFVKQVEEWEREQEENPSG